MNVLAAPTGTTAPPGISGSPKNGSGASAPRQRVALEIAVDAGTSVAAVGRAAKAAYLEAMLTRHGGNRRRCARELATGRANLRRMMRDLAVAIPGPTRYAERRDGNLVRWRYA